ncbi:MAG TPA: hypothetical protein VF862_01440 [Gemmatimonadales bacterium]
MSRSIRARLTAVIVLATCLTTGLAAQQAAPALGPALWKSLTWRHIGPEGNRVSAVAGVPGDPNVYYAGAASGGVFKSTDGGVHWSPVFDDQPVSSIGFIAVAPSDPNVVWVGTGEPNIRSNISLGWGIWKSTDAGKTWTKMGLDQTGRIARIAVHPRNPDVVLVSALGHAYGPQRERGVFRTTDGGKNWEPVLFVDENTGANDVEFDPANPRIVFATTWQLVIHTWGRTSGGPGSGIWKSADGGTTWTRLSGNGLPAKPFGKADVSVAPSNPNRVYALIETSDGVPLPGVEAERGELWRSDDAGSTWKVASFDRQLGGRTHYYNRMSVMPDNENEAYFTSADWSKTLDGGATTITPPAQEVPGYDHHDLWIDPTNGNRMVVGHDGGVSVTTNRGRSWLQVQLPIAQIYHVTVDDRIPYFVFGNRQDGPSSMGPSNSRLQQYGMGIPRGMWQTVGGGESGWATPDPHDPEIVWSSASGFGSVGGIVSRFDRRTGVAQNVEVWPEVTTGHSAAEVKYRFQWTFPVVVSVHARNTLYVGSQHVHRTTDGGRSWQAISPDLTRNDKSRQGISGGLTPDNIGVEYAGVVFALAESKLDPKLLWAGTNDGLVQVTRDGGATWTNVSANIPGLPAWGTVSNIAASRHDAGTAYVTVDGHQVNNRDPWIYRTADYGKTWKLIVAGIPKTPLSYVHWVREDPVRRGLLYAGTENAVYLSFDDGGQWHELQGNLPHAPVHDITVQERFNDLVIATYGRGLWIMDDITPLQQLTTEVMARPAHLFGLRPAWRFRVAEPPYAPMYDPVTGENPPLGAVINYWLKAKADSVAITVLDASGTTVKTLAGTTEPGLNRVTWDLLTERSKEPRVRVAPLYAPERAVPAEGAPSPTLDRVRMLVPPGRYTVRLVVAGQELTQTLEVRKDPNTPGTEADIAQQAAFWLEVKGDLERTIEMANALETVRYQLAALKTVVTVADVKGAADTLEQQLVAVEEQLAQLRTTERGQDLIRYPAKLGEKLVYLARDVSSTDNAPTQAQRDVAAVLRERLTAAKADYDRVMGRDVAAFNLLLRDRGLAGIITP